ncbi:hypothetical protein AXG93_3105s1400 [Marchantia polymorpha subsp. ruderalis]|uniref:Integrase catalytic domain-containing protein n=1 Tax=Marchantia polymorpha subsp. ruderalis TaxID=1480154 RepID=A0A176WLP5_MARPO|nr:hypothetical protein AXG93_3105s1400 [Marchantia polymorpha subsp. ruderalis]
MTNADALERCIAYSQVKSGESVAKHISKFRLLLDQLAPVGQTIPEAEAYTCLLRSLLIEYRSFLRSIRQKMKCFYCKKRSHLASECRKKKHDSASSHSTPNDHQRLYVTALTSIGMDSAWYVDSGATQHMAYNKIVFVTYTELTSKEFAYLGDDSRQPIQGKGKSTRAKFPSKGATRAIELFGIELFGLVHTDICGPLSTQTFSGHNALEYKSRAFTDFCTLHGIQRQLSVPDTPEQNGVAERKNRTLIASVLAMLTHSGLSHGYWGETIHTDVYLQNRSPSKALPNDKTPYELWHGQKPDLRRLKVFGCTPFALVERGHRGKIDPKSVECVFLGYSSTAKGYRVQRKDSHKILEGRSVRFTTPAVREATFHHQHASIVPPADQEGFTPFAHFH